LVEGLCPAAGLPKPALVVVDDAAPNALACGRRPRDAAIAVTQGLLDKLNRIELEGVLAHELSHIKNLDILPGTLAAVLAAPVGTRVVAAIIRPEREALADAGGVAMTRYPPGLLAALEKIEADPTPFRSRSRSIAHLWFQPPETGAVDHPPFEERIEALREL
jgi:heat shock protein HtpX